MMMMAILVDCPYYCTYYQVVQIPIQLLILPDSNLNPILKTLSWTISWDAHRHPKFEEATTKDSRIDSDDDDDSYDEG